MARPVVGLAGGAARCEEQDAAEDAEESEELWRLIMRHFGPMEKCLLQFALAAHQN